MILLEFRIEENTRSGPFEGVWGSGDIENVKVVVFLFGL